MGKELSAAPGPTPQAHPFCCKQSVLGVSSASPRLTLTPVPLLTGEDLKGDTFGLENIYRNFQPSLESVDPTTEVTQDPQLPAPSPPQLGASPLCLLPGAAWGLPSLPLTQAATHPHPVAPEPVHSSAPGVLWTRNPSLLRQGTTDR